MISGEKIVRRGEPNEELLRIIRVNSRAAETVMGDFNAEVACLRTGVARISELYQKYGADTVEASIERILRRARNRHAPQFAPCQTANGKRRTGWTMTGSMTNSFAYMSASPSRAMQ